LKNVVITGSSRGLGFEMANCFLEAGCNVTISGSNPVNLAKASERLKVYGDRVLAVLCDVRQWEQHANLWGKSQDRWGKIDIWINNAGISQAHQAMWELSPNETDNLMQTNLMGVIYGSQIAMLGMLRQGEGQIFNTEGFGSNDMLRKGLNLYGTSKRALTHFTKALSQEAEGTNIHVGTLSPGMMVTEFVTGPVGAVKRTVDDSTKKIFNILGDRPQPVAQYLVAEMLKNKKNGAHIEWLTRSKMIWRFAKAPFVKRDLFLP
jgi:NAD(P)-dependent dehydrogenase (short-subunit alcohol dehydrogenase family)